MVLNEWIRCSHYLIHRVLRLRSRQKYLLLDFPICLLWLLDSTASAHNAQARTSCSRFPTMVAQLVRPKICQPNNQEDGGSVLGFLEGASNAFFQRNLRLIEREHLLGITNPIGNPDRCLRVGSYFG